MDLLDHRMLGPRLDLFHFDDEAPGAAFWRPRGLTLYGLIERYIRTQMRACGFQEVRTPQLLSRALWERSGHWEKFGANMFVFADGERTLALKPMSCPGHVQLFRQQLRSYRDLPLRYAEFGACHRYEPSGSLHGLMRGRAFTQDDAHVFCLPEHVAAEVKRFCELLRRVYLRFGFREFAVGLSTRPESREGSDVVWDEAEAMLEAAARAANLAFHRQSGEGAFYGPKLEFILKDRQNREWQCGTIQLDMVLPTKLDAQVVAPTGQTLRPVMIHHAVLGSLERFIAVLLEEHAGHLPFWVAPEQIVVAPVGAGQQPYAEHVATLFGESGLRCRVDDSQETLSRRILSAHELGIPIFATVGAKEVAAGSVSLRDGAGGRKVLGVAQAIEELRTLETTQGFP
jgi:threonyl-tRNA synthetase